MAILCLAKNFADLKEKLNNIIVGYNDKNETISVKDLDVGEAMAT